MQVIPNEPQSPVRHMTKREMIINRISGWWKYNIRRKLPYLVWRGQEVDVCVTFKNLRLAPDCTVDNIRYEGDMETLWKAENALGQLGLEFDKGTGRTGRNWEWDWSLYGDVSLSFRGKHKGERKPRHKKPDLRLVPKKTEAAHE